MPFRRARVAGYRSLATLAVSVSVSVDVVACSGGSSIGSPGPQPTATPTVAPMLSLSTFTLTSAEQSPVLPTSPDFQYTPDEHMSYLKQPNGSFDLWAAGGGTYGSYLFRTPDLFSLGAAQTVFAPSGAGTTAFDADYAGPGSVFPAADGTDLLMVYHAENHLFGGAESGGSPFYAGIGLARSHDGGVTWQRGGEIISGRDPQQATQPPGGAGAATPTAVEMNGFIYVIFREIDLQSNVRGFGIARAPIASDGAPGSWQKYDLGSFGTPGLGGAFSPLAIVLDPDAPGDERQPHVSFNTYLHQFIMTAVGNGAIYALTSPDLIHWANGVVALTAQFPDATVTDSEVHDWYPTLISSSQASDALTARSGYLYYAEFLGDGTSHHYMRRRAFELTGR